MSNIWNLGLTNVDRLGHLVWRFALILYGSKFMADITASVLYIYTVNEPAMSAHRPLGYGASVGEFSAAISMLLQLLGARFAIEIGVRLLGRPTP